MSTKNQSSSTPHLQAENIPESTMDQAFHWAMIMGDADVTPESRQQFSAWLNEHPLHQTAWNRVRLVELEFTDVRPTAKQGADFLNRMANQRRRKRKQVSAGLLSVVFMVGLVLFYEFPQWRYDYATGTQEQQAFRLANGAQVYLDLGTRLDIEYEQAGGTLLRLYQGRIMVETSGAAPENKPSVLTSDGRFTPVGTRFQVDTAKNRSTLFVDKGQVEIKTGNLKQLVVAQQYWQISEQKISPQKANGLIVDGWMDSVVEANNARLGDVLFELKRHHTGVLRYDDEVANLRVTGVFRLDNIDQALSSLQESLPVKVDQLTNLWITVSMRK